MMPEATHEAVAELNAAEARELTNQIRTAVDVAWDLIIQAFEQRAWEPLGYSSWDDYCKLEFGACRLRIPRERRSEVVGSLTVSGLSQRAIASATGLDRKTIRRDLDEQVGEMGPPAVDLGSAARTVTGLDGKTYPTKPAQREPRRGVSESLNVELARKMAQQQRSSSANPQWEHEQTRVTNVRNVLRHHFMSRNIKDLSSESRQTLINDLRAIIKKLEQAG